MLPGFTRQEVCHEKIRPFRFVACCSRYRAYLGVRLVSPYVAVGKPQPPTADAQGNPVQFVATGYFSQQPSPVKLTAPAWGACNPKPLRRRRRAKFQVKRN